MEYGENDDTPDGVTKWPFYLSALFILALVLGFAYLHLQENNTLDQWQLTTCILASGLASILVFIPHLLDRFLYLVFDPANRKDEELHRKTYFDIKEMRGDLDSLAVKIDKVPAVVDKILSDSVAKAEDTGPVLDKLATDLEETREELLEKLGKLLEVSEHPPLLPEPDPAIAQANEAIGKLESSLQSVAGQLKKLQQSVAKLPTKFPESEGSPVPESPPPEPKQEDKSTEEIQEEEFKPEVNEGEIEVEEEQSDPVSEEEEPEDLVDDSAEEDQIEEEGSPLVDDDAETITEEEEPEPLAEESEEEEPTEEENDPVATDPVEVEEMSEDDAETGELDLNLPDPEETLRKVDALLAGEDASDGPGPDSEEKKTKSSKTGSTSVVANVMIGIGNKPYLRGEGAGLSWDEGVPMNFIEIGKWAWTPTRKNAALTVQVYRNDEDPDNGGKIEVKSGEEIEITPDFG